MYEAGSVRAATSKILLSGSIGEPAFPSRPGSAQATERNEGDGRSGATRSRGQHVLSREHGEDGEHRTFSAVSTVAHSSFLAHLLSRWQPAATESPPGPTNDPDRDPDPLPSLASDQQGTPPRCPGALSPRTSCWTGPSGSA